MKLAMPTRYLARVFGSVAPHDGKLERARELVSKLRAPKPLVVEAILEPVDGQPVIQPAIVDDDGFRLTMLAGSIDLTRQPTIASGGANMGSFETFAASAPAILASAAVHYQLRGFRLALVLEGLLGDLSDEAMERLRRRLLNDHPMSKGEPSFEWDWRIANHGRMPIGAQQEVTNEIVNLRRSRVDFGVGSTTLLKNGDRIFAMVDVNTSPLDADARFGPAEIEEFFLRAAKQHAALSGSVASMIGEQG